MIFILKKCLTNVRAYCVAAKVNEKLLHRGSETNHALRNSVGTEKLEKELLEKSKREGQQKTLHIAVIGVPNAGKSTFINNLINHRVCPTSCKVHTTRNANKAIYTTGNTQLVFSDTPGLVTQREIKKHNLEQSFKSAYRHALQHANVVAVMHDVSSSWTRNQLHATVLDTLKAYPALPSFLILNKIDALKSKRILLDLIRTLTNGTLSGAYGKQKSKVKHAVTKENNENMDGVELRKREIGWNNFSDVFMVSSITGSGLNDIHEYLLNSAKPGAWQYPKDTFTDVTPEVLIVDSVQARLLDYLPQEIPYNLQCAIEYYNVDKDTIYASVQVICPTERIERLICGESNGKLRQITERVTSDLVETFGKPISLTIATLSKKPKQ